MIHPTPILSAARMQAWDTHTIDDLSIPSRTLMERAAHTVTQFLLRRTDLFPDGPVLCLCGPGNNGGDGFAVARFLLTDHISPRRATILYTGPVRASSDQPDTARMSRECARQYELAKEDDVEVICAEMLNEDQISALLKSSAVVVDAVFGIGLSRAVEGCTARLFEAIAAQGIPTLAVDIPSGIHADSGAILGTALPARATVTMQALKSGLLLYPGAQYTGEIAVADIGILPPSDDTPDIHLADAALLAQVLRPRARRTHKGTYGKVALVCGSEEMSGAAILSLRAALRSGAGLCVAVTPEANHAILATAVPEAIIKTYPTNKGLAAAARAIRQALADVDAVVVGCGLSTHDVSHAVLTATLDAIPADGSVPLVVDADGLNLLASDASLHKAPIWNNPHAHVILTPHPAEMSRLCGRTVADILADLPCAARELAASTGAVVVLKDAHTVIAGPDGELYLSVAGNAGMAKGGCGDVLAGVIGALVAAPQSEDTSLSAISAAAVYLHAAAGDIAARHTGEYGLLASDIVEALPRVTRSLSDSRTVMGHIQYEEI